MGTRRPARQGRLVTATGLLVVAVVAACGDAGTPATRRVGATTSTSLTASSTASSTEAVPTAPTPSIPDDPGSLAGCGSVVPGTIYATPAEVLPDVASSDGLAVSAAWTTGGGPIQPGPATTHAASWVRADADGAVDATLRVTVQPGGPGWAGGPTGTTIHGRPASVGPELNRGGPTGAFGATWSEAGADVRAVAHGLDAGGLRSLLESAGFTGTGLRDLPPGWAGLGEGPAPAWARVTVVQLDSNGPAPGGSPEEPDDPSVATVELTVDRSDPPDRVVRTPAGPGYGPSRLVDVDGRPGVLAVVDDAHEVLATTDRSGRSVLATGPDGDQLLRLVSGLEEVTPSDRRLVGVPMGTPSAMAGAWCRHDH